jgi:histone methylation protein DOT1
MSIGELIQIKKANFRFRLETARLYYAKSWRFAIADLALGFATLFFNPYRTCRKKGTIYGETPPSSLHKIAATCSLGFEDCYLELGSGLGKGCLWISQFAHCRAIGVEKVPLFYHLSSAISSLFRFKRLSFLKADLSEADFSAASCVYLYSTCMGEVELSLLAEKMAALPLSAKVVTVSAPLPETPHLALRGSFPLSFPWGETEGFLHVKI